LKLQLEEERKRMEIVADLMTQMRAVLLPSLSSTHALSMTTGEGQYSFRSFVPCALSKSLVHDLEVF
jgi:hypothetical protein